MDPLFSFIQYYQQYQPLINQSSRHNFQKSYPTFKMIPQQPSMKTTSNTQHLDNDFICISDNQSDNSILFKIENGQGQITNQKTAQNLFTARNRLDQVYEALMIQKLRRRQKKLEKIREKAQKKEEQNRNRQIYQQQEEEHLREVKDVPEKNKKIKKAKKQNKKLTNNTLDKYFGKKDKDQNKEAHTPIERQLNKSIIEIEAEPPEQKTSLVMPGSPKKLAESLKSIIDFCRAVQKNMKPEAKTHSVAESNQVQNWYEDEDNFLKQAIQNKETAQLSILIKYKPISTILSRINKLSLNPTSQILNFLQSKCKSKT